MSAGRSVAEVVREALLDLPYGGSRNDEVAAILSALTAAGYAVVPVELLEDAADLIAEITTHGTHQNWKLLSRALTALSASKGGEKT